MQGLKQARAETIKECGLVSRSVVVAAQHLNAYDTTLRDQRHQQWSHSVCIACNECTQTAARLAKVSRCVEKLFKA